MRRVDTLFQLLMGLVVVYLSDAWLYITCPKSMLVIYHVETTYSQKLNASFDVCAMLLWTC